MITSFQIPLLLELFHFEQPDMLRLLLAALFGIVSIPWFEIFKLIRKPRLT
ncbi:MAG: hypothetical protein OEZ15_08740 [Gammaproteobacteria bacterium]|nr:hypothetical protein [Gammaproteobacteria bacterium]